MQLIRACDAWLKEAGACNMTVRQPPRLASLTSSKSRACASGQAAPTSAPVPPAQIQRDPFVPAHARSLFCAHTRRPLFPVSPGLDSPCLWIRLVPGHDMHLCPYHILATGGDSGLIEYVSGNPKPLTHILATNRSILNFLRKHHPYGGPSSKAAEVCTAPHAWRKHRVALRASDTTA